MGRLIQQTTLNNPSLSNPPATNYRFYTGYLASLIFVYAELKTEATLFGRHHVPAKIHRSGYSNLQSRSQETVKAALPLTHFERTRLVERI